MTSEELTLDVSLSVDIKSTIGTVYSFTLRRLAEDHTLMDGSPLPMVLERWPGGRWYRDLGDRTGHLWGFVQVIKPPTLLEFTGPLFMSSAVAGHLSLRLTQQRTTTHVALRHQVVGFIQADHREGVAQGWQHLLAMIKQHSEAP